MKKNLILIFLLFCFFKANAQHKIVDSLRTKLNATLDDTARLNIMLELSRAYYLSNPDSNIIVAQQAYTLAEKNKLLQKQSTALSSMATGYATLGDYPKAVQLFYRSLRIAKSIHDVLGITRVANNLGDTYIREGDYSRALHYLLPAEKQWRTYIKSHKFNDRASSRLWPTLLLNIGEDYLDLGKIDSADHYLQLSYKEGKNFIELLGNIYSDFGEVEIARGHTDKALKYLSDAIRLSQSTDNPQLLSQSYLSESKLYHNNKRQDSAEYYAQKALVVASAGKFEQDVLNAGKVLYNYYDEDHNLPLAYKYFRMATAAKDSLYSQDRVKQVLSLDFEEKQRQQEIAAAQEKYRASVRMYSLIAGMVVLVVLAFIFCRPTRQGQKPTTCCINKRRRSTFKKRRLSIRWQNCKPPRPSWCNRQKWLHWVS